jgi:peptidoglycan L-alanyl-D-glutamate endopeptidase CwlK
MSFVFGKSSKARLAGVHPSLVACAEKALSYGEMDFAVVQGVRTKAEQARLYAQGRTAPGPKVTWTLNSKHLPQKDGYGHAIDIAPYIDGKISWDEKHFYNLAKLMLTAAKELGILLEWGGNWKTKDLPHFEIRTGEKNA